MNFDCGVNNFITCKNLFKVEAFPALKLFAPGPYLEKKIGSAIDLPLNERDLILEIYNEFKSDDITEGNAQTFVSFVKKAQENGKLPIGLLYNDVHIFNVLFRMVCIFHITFLHKIRTLPNISIFQYSKIHRRNS